jgi:GT2 family glycosyltransferase
LISVIIPTLNRPTLLKDLLLNLENQAKKPNQIILVDASEPKHQINQKLFSSISIPIIYVKSDIKV